MDVRSCAQLLFQCRDMESQWSSITCQPSSGLRDGPLSHPDAGGELQHTRNPALRDPQLVVQRLDGRRQPRSAAVGGRADLVGAQSGMLTTHRLPARWAGHDGNVVRRDRHRLRAEITNPGAIVLLEQQLAHVSAGSTGVGHGNVYDDVLLL